MNPLQGGTKIYDSLIALSREHQYALLLCMRTNRGLPVHKPVQAALAVLDSLHADHAAAGEIHNQVEALVRRWLEDNNLSGEQAHRLAEMLDELSAIYQRHVAAEDNELFPLATSILEKSDYETRAVGARNSSDQRDVLFG
jgi:hemerythrin-like domain-containing protein